jgi:hypothetical protein
VSWHLIYGKDSVQMESARVSLALVPDLDLMHPLRNLDKHILLYPETVTFTCPWLVRINKSKIEVSEKLHIIGLVGLEKYVGL